MNSSRFAAGGLNGNPLRLVEVAEDKEAEDEGCKDGLGSRGIGS